MRPRRPRLHPVARAAGGLALALACAAAPAAGAEGGADAFEVSTLALAGRPLDVWVVPDGRSRERLVAVSAEGAPPDERRHLVVFAPGPAGGVVREAAFDLPPEAVAFDVAQLDPGSPPELALLSAGSLRLRPVGPGAGPERTLALEPALPLPPPTRGFFRQPILGHWDGGTRPSALVPALGGLLSVPLDGGAPRALAFPLYAFYYAGDDGAGVRSGAVQSIVAWPELATGDDDGDGRSDLLALSRYDVAVYRSAPGGLPAEPTRRVTLRPFSADEELRHLATSVSLFARDVDGDGLVDLVQHRTVGTLLRSHATTSVWRNHGSGADPAAAPDARLEGSGGFGSVFLEDLDGDGRLEALQLLVPFGAVQLVRAVLTDSVRARLRAFRFPAPGVGAARLAFSDELTLAVDAREGRTAGVLPTAAGDFDGDGLRDLAFGESLVRLALRLGEAGAEGPGFGPVVARQAMPAADRAVVGDFDGDGLDDVAAFDSRRGSGIALLRNRGVVGARRGEAGPPERPAPELRPAEPREAAGRAP